MIRWKVRHLQSCVFDDDQGYFVPIKVFVNWIKMNDTEVESHYVNAINKIHWKFILAAWNASPPICFHFPFLKERRAELEMDDDEVATRSAIQFKISNLFPQFQQIPMKFWRQLTHFERNVTLATAISTLSRYKWKEWEKLHIVSLWMNESRQWHRRPGARLVERWWIVRLLFCRPMIKFPLLGGPWIVIFEDNDDTCKWADSKVAIFWKKSSSRLFKIQICLIQFSWLQLELSASF